MALGRRVPSSGAGTCEPSVAGRTWLVASAVLVSFEQV